MSIFHLTVKRGSRSENRLSADKHDYIMRLGRFSKRHDGELAHSENGNMPAWAADDPRSFWVEVDAHERANATLYHEVEFALPRELTQQQQIEAARDAVRRICGDQHPYSWGMHDKEGNPHVHLEFSGRMLDGIDRDADQFFKRYNAKNPERGGCRKESSGDARGPEWVKQLRKDWQDIANRHLAAAGQDARIDHRSNKDRGLDEAPGIHLGRRVTRLEMHGKSTWRGNKNREVSYLNASLREIRSKLKEKEHEQHPGRNGKPSQQPTHSPRHIGTAAPKRAFTAWRDSAYENHPGLRSSRRIGPERMPVLRQHGAGARQSEARDAVLQRSVSRSGGRDRGVHGASGKRRFQRLSSIQQAQRRQAYKARLLAERYQQKGAAADPALAEQLAFFKARKDGALTIALKGGGRVLDTGDRLLTRGNHFSEVQAALAVARLKGWRSIKLSGSESFMRAAWLEAQRAGITVVGYQPPQDLVTQFTKEKIMLDQGAGGAALTPDVGVTLTESQRRWLKRFGDAHTQLAAERKLARAALEKLPEIDLKALAKELVSEVDDGTYREREKELKRAEQAKREAGNMFTRRIAESRHAAALQGAKQAWAAALAMPAVKVRLDAVRRQNDERKALNDKINQIGWALGELEFHYQELKKGRGEHDAVLRDAWKHRNQQPLKLWQEAAIGTAFSDEAVATKARQQNDAEAAKRLKDEQLREQAQKEIQAQEKADEIQDQLGKPGLSIELQEQLEQQQRYYLSLADGRDEREAKEYSANPKTKALRR